MNKINPYLLGISVTYFIFGIRQCFQDGIFPDKFYFMISVVSLIFALIELAQTIYRFLNKSSLYNDRVFDVFDEYDKTMQEHRPEVAIKYQERVMNLHKENELSIKRRKRITVVYTFAITISIVFSTYTLLSTPWLKFSNEAYLNKISGINSLFSFSLMFLVSLLNEAIDKTMTEKEKKNNELIRMLEHEIALVKNKKND